MKHNLSIYFIIGFPPNEFFDSNRIGGYFLLSNSILLHSISKIFYELPSDNFHILGVGQKEDYLLLQHTNNNAYCQLGNTNEDFFKVSYNQPIKILLFPDIKNIFKNLGDQVKNDSSENIIIILQDHGTAFHFNEYPYLLFLYHISNLTNKNFFIYNDSCHSGSLVDLLSKNVLLFNYFEKHSIGFNEDFIFFLYVYASFQSTLFDYFYDFTPIFLEETVFFLSKIECMDFNYLFKISVLKAINEIIAACNNNQHFFTRKKTGEYFLAEINESFFVNLKEYFDFDDWIDKNKPKDFENIIEFLDLLKKLNVKYLANLIMIKVFNDFTTDDFQTVRNISFFKRLSNFKLFKRIQKSAFSLPELDINASDKTIEKHKNVYEQISLFFSQYFYNNLTFFEFKPKIEIVTSTSFDKTSLSYPSISVNSITKVFPNSPPFAFLIRNAFFYIREHRFDFPDYAKHFSFDSDTKTLFYFPSYGYQKYEKPDGKIRLHSLSPRHYIYPDNKLPFKFFPSASLSKKISTLRFLTHSIRNRLLEFSKLECFHELNFSVGFSKIPSSILINFISLSILPYSDDFLSDLKLNNKNFIDVLKFSNLISKVNSTESSINKQPKQISYINQFEFILFFSVTLSSKIRYMLAQQLLLLCRNDSTFVISLFSINELKYTKEFISTNFNNNDSDESIKLFLTKLFSENFIDKYYNIKIVESQKIEILNSLNDIKKKPEFNLQKMFLDLESSILNILPNDVFVFSTIYSYMLLKQNADIDLKLLLDTLSSLLEENIYQIVKEKLDSLNNSSTDIIQFCDQYVSKRLNDTFNFLQSFYQSYYFTNFCKVSNRYDKITYHFKCFLENFKDDQEYIKLLTGKLEPFPLFCLPFIFFDDHSYMDFAKNINSPTISDSSSLFASNYFYSQQFRIRLSNLSQYNELKKSVLEDINVLNKYVGDVNFNVKNFLSFPFFQDPSSSPESFHFELPSSKPKKELKYPFEFCVNTNFENYLKKSISTFIEQFISNIKKFVQFNPKVITDFNCKTSNDLDDSKIFFSNNEGISVYIDSIKNNLIDLLDILNITNRPLTYDITLKEEAKDDIDHLAFSVLAARFNNKVEIEPILLLIPKYESKVSKDLSDPTIKEYMALCSALQFTFIDPFDKLKKRIYTESSQSKNEEEESKEECYSSSSSPNKVDNYRNKFDDGNNNNNHHPSIVQNADYQQSIDEAFQLSTDDIFIMREKYDLKHKKWTEVIWTCFFDFFNEKLKKVNLYFDINDDYSQGSSYFNCLAKENRIIIEYLPQIEDLPDLHRNDCWIFRFLSLHKEHKFIIKSAYVYAFISSYIFLSTFYTFGGF